MREQIELLEHHADAGAEARQVAAARRGALVAEIDAAVTDLQRAGRRLLEQVDAAQKVDLPQPDGPITTTTWPRSTSSDTPRTASTVPKLLRRPSALTITSPLLVNARLQRGPPTG